MGTTRSSHNHLEGKHGSGPGDIPGSSHKQQEEELEVHPGGQVRDRTECKYAHNIVQTRSEAPGLCFNRGPGPLVPPEGVCGRAQVRLVWAIKVY